MVYGVEKSQTWLSVPACTHAGNRGTDLGEGPTGSVDRPLGSWNLHTRRLIRRLAALYPLSGLPRGLTLLRAHTCDLPHNSAGTTPSRNQPVRKREAPSACGSYRSGHYTQEHRDHLPYPFCSQTGREAKVFAAKTLNQRRSTQWDQFHQLHISGAGTIKYFNGLAELGRPRLAASPCLLDPPHCLTPFSELPAARGGACVTTAGQGLRRAL